MSGVQRDGKEGDVSDAAHAAKFPKKISVSVSMEVLASDGPGAIVSALRRALKRELDTLGLGVEHADGSKMFVEVAATFECTEECAAAVDAWMARADERRRRRRRFAWQAK